MGIIFLLNIEENISYIPNTIIAEFAAENARILNTTDY